MSATPRVVRCPSACAPALWLAVAISGCSNAPPRSASSEPATISADQRAALPAALSTEKRWLDAWFRGTPVIVSQGGDGALSVAVPRKFCFDPGRTDVKPALAAVLDKWAQSMQRVDAARMTVLAAPDDTPPHAGLAAQRAQQLRRYLIDRGVPGSRLADPSVAELPTVRLRMQAVNR